MFGLTRSNPFEELFSFQREVDRLFNQFWNDLPSRVGPAAPGSFNVNATDDGWRIDVPMPGIDPQYVTLEAAGQTLSIRAEVPGKTTDAPVRRYEQTVAIPTFLDMDKLAAVNRHGMLELTLPFKESVKPRRIEIQGATPEQKQLSVGV